MRRLCLAAWFALACCVIQPANAVGVDVGGVTLEVPAPSGSVDLQQTNPRVFEAMATITAKLADMKAAFVAKEDLTHLQETGLRRYHAVLLTRSLAGRDINDQAFQALQQAMRSQASNLGKMAESAANNTFADNKDGFNERYQAKLDELKMNETRMVWVGQTARSATFEMWSKVRVAANGKSEETLVYGINTIVHQRGRVLTLATYSYNQNDEAWARKANQAWSNAVLAQN